MRLLLCKCGDLRLQRLVALDDRLKFVKVGLQPLPGRDLGLHIPALGTQPLDIGREPLLLTFKFPAAFPQVKQPLVVAAGTLKFLTGAGLRGPGVCRLFLRTGNRSPQLQKMPANPVGIQFLEPSGEFPACPLPGIYEFFEALHAVLLEVIDAQNLHEPVFP